MSFAIMTSRPIYFVRQISVVGLVLLSLEFYLELRDILRNTSVCH